MTYKEEVTKGQIKSGGSSTLIWALSIVAAACLVFMVSCGDETTIVESADHHFQPPGDPKPDDWECKRKHCDKKGHDGDHSSILYSFSVGEIYYNSHADGWVEIKSIENNGVNAAIGIDGSQFDVWIEGIVVEGLYWPD